MAIPQNEIDMLAAIRNDPGYDDSNLRPAEQEIARRLLRKGLIDGVPVEGSDAAVDGLFLTDVGNLALTWYGPTSDDDAVVDWYTLRIKQKLAKRSTDATKGILNWREGQNSLSRLFMRFMMEVGELGQALYLLDENEGTIQERMEGIIDEAVDCGAVAMMVADFAKMVQADAS